MATKQESIKPQSGHNWTWPRKTWLQQRLDIIKARERETQQKPAENPGSPTAVNSDPDADQDSQER